MAHLALQPLLQHHASAACREAGDVFCLGLAFRYAHPLEQLDENAVVEGLVERDPVFFFDTAGGVAYALPQCAVVGENEQAFAIGIQAAYIVGVAVFGGE